MDVCRKLMQKMAFDKGMKSNLCGITTILPVFYDFRQSVTCN